MKNSMEKLVSVDDAARCIGVSSATIRNWAKAGHLTPVTVRPITFSADSIDDLKSSISSGLFGRLRTRANKSGSARHSLPLEYAGNSELVCSIEDAVSRFRMSGVCVEFFLYIAALRLLEKKGEVHIDGTAHVFNLIHDGTWARTSVQSVMIGWQKNLQGVDETRDYSPLYASLTPCECDDYLGLLYQSIHSEGMRSEQGAYYTPSNIVVDALNSIRGPITTFLDPCCGTGKYLLLAAKIFDLHPDAITGFDSNATAVWIARINLLLAFTQKEFTPHIYCLDSLAAPATGATPAETNALAGRFDAIATNPPWGAYKNAGVPTQFEGIIRSGETFSLFLAKSIELLKDDGQLSFLLPASFLNIRAHADIRELILNKVSIGKITKLGRQFTGVFTPVIRLDGIKRQHADGGMVTVESNGVVHTVGQNRFRENVHFTYDIETGDHDERLIKKIYSVDHTTLFDNAEWALGIVTGNNEKYVFDVHSHGTEPVIRGRDVAPFHIREPGSFIRFFPDDFQQTAPERLFRAKEKLVYKFISSRLVFAYDGRQMLTLNSANSVIPAIPGLSMKAALAFLNSTVFQYIFAKKHSTHKVLRGDLEQLPFPRVETKLRKGIERLADRAVSTGSNSPELEDLLFSTFNLTGEEIAIILHSSGERRQRHEHHLP